MKAFGSDRIACAKAAFLFTLADETQEIVWHGLPQPIDACLRVLPWTSHCKGACVPIG